MECSIGRQTRGEATAQWLTMVVGRKNSVGRLAIENEWRN
jgi:hypothetical protein